MNLSKLQSEAEIKFDNFRNFDGSEYGLVLHEKIKKFIADQIQKAVEETRKEVITMLVNPNKYTWIDIEGQRLLNEIINDLSIY